MSDSDDPDSRVRLTDVQRAALDSASNRLQEDERRLGAELRLVRQAKDSIDALDKALAGGLYVAAAAALTGNNQAVLAVAAPEVLAQLSSLVTTTADAVIDSAGDLILAEIARWGLPLDPSSRLPRLTTDGLFLTLSIDAKRRRATIAARDAKPITIPLDPVAVVDALVQERERVFSDRIPLQQFADHLHRAFEAVATGDTAVVTAVRERFIKELKDPVFDGASFNVHLSRVLGGKVSTTDGWYMSLEHTKDTDRGIILYQHESAGYVGHLHFVQGAQP
jgi:hypothetical protein